MNYQNPHFSIIIPTYNRPQLLQRAIKSVLTQSFENYEIIVVDDGSNKDIASVIENFCDHRIIYFRHEQSRGASAARNTGIQNARGTWLSFLDDDDEFLPHFLSKTFDRLQAASEETGFCWCGIQRVWDREHGEEIVDETTFQEYDPSGVQPELQYLSVGTNYGLTVRNACFREIGGFSEELSSVVDTDLLFRLGKKYKYTIVPDVLVKYHFHAGEQLTDISIQRAESLDRVISKHLDVLRKSPRHLLNFYRNSAAIYYQLGNRTRGRKRIFSMLKLSPVRWRSWKSLFCYELFGTEQLGLREKLGLRKR